MATIIGERRASQAAWRRLRDNRIVELFRQGLSAAAIVERCASLPVPVRTVGTVYTVLRAARAADPTVPRRAAGRRKRPGLVVIPPAALNALAPEASVRGLSPEALAVAIVETVATEGLVAAVLDDGPA